MNKLIIIALFLFLFFVTPLLSISWWDDLQNLAFSAYLAGTLILFWIFKIPLKVSVLHLFWLAFLLLGLLSFFWSIDPSLIWYQLFSWSNLMLWSVVVGSIVSHFDIEKTLFGVLAIIFFIVIGQICYGLWLGLYPIKWQPFFRNNSNYSACYIVVLLPFVLLYPNKSIYFRILKVISFLGAIYLVRLFTASGAIVSLFFIAAALGVSFIKMGSKRLINLLLIAFLLATGFLFVSQSEFFSFISEVSLSHQTARIFWIESSIRSWMQHPFVGLGLGHWHIGVYQYDFAEPFPYPTFDYFHSHNLYTKILVELGAVGFLLFFIPFFTILIKWYRSVRLSSFDFACWLSIGMYLITIAINAVVNFHQYHFSAIELIAFLSVGYLSSKYSNSISLKSVWTMLHVSIVWCLLSLLWFAYHAYCHNTYFKAVAAEKEHQYEKAITILEGIYNPVLRTTHDMNNSIPFKLALLNQQIGNYDKAEELFIKAIRLNPNSTKNHFYLSVYYFNCLNLELAESSALESLRMHSNNMWTLELLAKIAIESGDLDEARYYLRTLNFILDTRRYAFPVEVVILQIEQKIALAEKHLE